MSDKPEPTLDEAYALYVAGKIMRRDLFRMLIDAVQDLQETVAAHEDNLSQAFANLDAMDAPLRTLQTPTKRGGWPKGRKRKSDEMNGHSAVSDTAD